MAWTPLTTRNHEPQPLQQSLTRLAARVGATAPAVASVVFARWTEFVGESISDHVRPIQMKDKTLIVEADDLAWATQIKFLINDLIKRLEEELGAQAPKVIDVHVTKRSWREGHNSAGQNARKRPGNIAPHTPDFGDESPPTKSFRWVQNEPQVD